MLLENKTAVVYGAGGSVGGAVTRTFAREGAHVYLTGRSLPSIELVAKEIVAAGGVAEAARVDALDEAAIEDHLLEVAKIAKRVDISFNAVGHSQQGGVQGTPLVELTADTFSGPIHTYTRSTFLTARAAARHMINQGSGVIVTLTASAAKGAYQHVGGMGPAWAAVEALTRGLAAELGPHGVRAVCVRGHAIPETPLIDEVLDLMATSFGMTPQDLHNMMLEGALLRRLPTLQGTADLVAFLASDRAAGMTATVTNLSGGTIVD